MSEKLRAVVFRDGPAWVAHCIDFDVFAQAPSCEVAKARLVLAASIDLQLRREMGILLGKPPLWDRLRWWTRERFWFVTSDVRVTFDDPKAATRHPRNQHQGGRVRWQSTERSRL